jgi:hypothetical protein
LVRFGVREVFHPPAVVEHGYAEEYPTVLNEYMAFQGFGGKTATQFPDAKDTNGVPVPAHLATWGEIFWAAHWNPPSAGQGYEMYQRYYTESRYGPSPDILDDNGDIIDSRRFNKKNLELLLRVNDYPQPFRDKLIGIAYTPLGIRALRQLVTKRLISRADTYHAFRAQGYNDKNAETQTKLLWTTTTNNDKVIKDAFTNGIIDVDSALQTLTQQNNHTEDEAKNLVETWRLERQYNDAKITTVAIKRAYMGGIVGDGEVRGMLMQAGLEIDRAASLARNWGLLRRYDRRQVTASKILTWFERRIITAIDVTARLQNLNFADIDITHMIQESMMKIESQNAKGQKQQQQQKQKQDKQQQVKQAKDTKAATPPKPAKPKYPSDTNLKAWFKQGIITEQQARDELKEQLYLADDIDHWIEANKPKG